MKYPDFRKAPEGATHWDSYAEEWCKLGAYYTRGGSWLQIYIQKDWGTERYIPIPVVDWSKAPEGLDYAYTTGPDWDYNPDRVGTVWFADVSGHQLDECDTRLVLGDASWVLLETRPETKAKEETPTLVKDYKILEVFVDDLSMPFRYRGYWGYLHISLSDNLIHGSIAQIKDLVTYEADTIVGIKEAFMDAVDDYILTREELGNGSY
jgi:hypothetical protein